MTAPTLTAEQRQAALAAAAKARKERAHLKDQLATGTMSIADVLDLADQKDQMVIKTKVRDVLTALPKIGPVMASHIMADLEISTNRKVGGLGVRQRRDLLARFS